MPLYVTVLTYARIDQMFPVLEPSEIEQLARFGERKAYVVGERIVATGEIPLGAFIILTRRVDVSQRGLGQAEPIVTHVPGSSLGELAQLSDRPSLAHALAVEAVQTLV